MQGAHQMDLLQKLTRLLDSSSIAGFKANLSSFAQALMHQQAIKDKEKPRESVLRAILNLVEPGGCRW